MKNKGITLIALVITIIVLLILAGVSIETLTGENGILTKAQRAKEETKTVEVEEQRQLAIAEATMNFEDTEYQGIKIPVGMAPTRIEGESTVDEGLVAIDKKGNEWVWIEVPKSIYKIEAYNEGKEPSGEIDYDTITKVLKAYAFPYTQGSSSQTYKWTDEWYAKDGNTYITEGTATEPKKKELDNGCGLTLSKYKETYETMLRSVYTNGGFWIGRYEAGIKGTTGADGTSSGRTSHIAITNDSPKAICQKDAIPYNFVYCSEAQKLASQMTPDGTRTSSLMFGIQWDLVCKFIEEKEVEKQGVDKKTEIIASINSNSGSWGNYRNQTLQIDSENAKQYATSSKQWGAIEKGKINTGNDGILLSTGASDSAKRLNIYDLAGNEWEWTLEYATADTNRPCSLRGGSNFDNATGPASYRYHDRTTSDYYHVSFRPVLY